MKTRVIGVLLGAVLAATLFAPLAATAKVTVTLTPNTFTVAPGGTQEFMVQIMGTKLKGVRLHVCDGNGENCVASGDSTLGTITVVGRDAKNNPIVHYTAPESLPSEPPCTLLPNGCQLQLRVRLRSFPKKKAFASVVLPDVAGPGGQGVVERVSVHTDGTAGNGYSSGGWVSSDGRFLAFHSYASNLVDGDTNGYADVFVRDTCQGAVDCTPATTRASVANDGSEFLDRDSVFGSALSANGRFVLFTSQHSAAYCYSYGGADFHDCEGFSEVLVRDTCFGELTCTPSTPLITGNSTGGPMSPDGRFVTFTGWDAAAYVRDTCLGVADCTPTSTLISVATDGTPANANSWVAAISSDGRFVAFASWASNLVAGDTNGVSDIFLRDTCQGAVGCTPSTTRVSLGADGSEGAGEVNGGAAMSNDGRYVLFGSFASNLVAGDTNGASDIFLRDTCQGAVECTPTTVRVSNSLAGTQANGSSYAVSASADGRYVAFASFATNLVPGDTNGVSDVFVRDTCLGAPEGCVPTTVRVSVAGDSTQANGSSGFVVISADGRFVGFPSGASNLVPGDTNSVDDVFLARTGY